MIKSMTGFASCEAKISAFGKIRVELRSTNHKFLETILHLPEEFLSLEDKIRRQIEAKLMRGRVVCAVSFTSSRPTDVFINQSLLKKYISAINSIRKSLHIKEYISLDALINLPGVFCLVESGIVKKKIWPHLKILVNRATDDLVKMRAKEGYALYKLLKQRTEKINIWLQKIKARFDKIIRKKFTKIKTDEERSSFLKDVDITEELERLFFHTQNFINKLAKGGAVGKELDFIAQEMQREANTCAAKSCDALISSWVVQVKSLVEKNREQLQNIE